MLKILAQLDKPYSAQTLDFHNQLRYSTFNGRGMGSQPIRKTLIEVIIMKVRSNVRAGISGGWNTPN